MIRKFEFVAQAQFIWLVSYFLLTSSFLFYSTFSLRSFFPLSNKREKMMTENLRNEIWYRVISEYLNLDFNHQAFCFKKHPDEKFLGQIDSKYNQIRPD